MSVHTWGLGKSGQLGNGKLDNCLVPGLVSLPTKSDVVGISSGGLFTACVTADGRVYTFGCGKYGRLGNNREEDSKTPVRVEKLADCHITKVSCGTWHACALDDQGQLFIWGYNKAHGVLGMVTESLSSPPVLLPLPQKLKISGVSCGNNFTIAWTTCGQAFSWGYGHHGALGHGDTADRKEVTKIQALRDHVIVTASAGYAHSGCVTDTGRVFMFGKGSDGALGLGPKNLQDATTPTLLPHLDDVPIAEVSCSVGEHHGHTLAVTQSGGVYAWGDGYKGKLGLGDQESRYIPTVIPQEHFGGEAVSHVSSGGIHSSAVSKVGQVSTWGCGSDGRLGHPEAQGHRYLFRSDVPRIVDKLKNIGRAQCVSASYYHTVALMEENK